MFHKDMKKRRKSEVRSRKHTACRMPHTAFKRLNILADSTTKISYLHLLRVNDLHHDKDT